MSKKNKKQEEVNQWFNVQQTCCVSCMHRNLCVYLLVCAGARACRCVTAECVRTSPPPPLSGWAAKEEDPRTRSQPITALGRCRLYRRRGSPETRSSPCLPLRKVRDVKNWHVHGHIYSKKISHALQWMTHTLTLDLYLQEAGRKTGTRTGLRSPPPLTLSTPSMWGLMPSLESSLYVSDHNTVQCARSYLCHFTGQNLGCSRYS